MSGLPGHARRLELDRGTTVSDGAGSGAVFCTHACQSDSLLLGHRTWALSVFSTASMMGSSKPMYRVTNAHSGYSSRLHARGLRSTVVSIDAMGNSLLLLGCEITHPLHILVVFVVVFFGCCCCAAAPRCAALRCVLFSAPLFSAPLCTVLCCVLRALCGALWGALCAALRALSCAVCCILRSRGLFFCVRLGFSCLPRSVCCSSALAGEASLLGCAGFARHLNPFLCDAKSTGNTSFGSWGTTL